MSKLGIGINENVYPISVTLDNTKNFANLKFGQVVEKELNLFEQSMQAGLVDMGGDDIMLKVWAPKIPTYVPKTGALTDADKRKRIFADIAQLKNQFTHILQRYLPTDKIVFDQFVGTEITTSNWEEPILNDNNLKEVFSNLVNQFAEQLTPFLDDKTTLSRMKILRQSADKAYPALPGGLFLSDSPFYEPMEVPAEATKVKFTKYEIDKGLTSTEIPTAVTDADATPEATPETMGSVFGSR